jgi:outer membrane protein assembly factor BamB
VGVPSSCLSRMCARRERARFIVVGLTRVSTVPRLAVLAFLLITVTCGGADAQSRFCQVAAAFANQTRPEVIFDFQGATAIVGAVGLDDSNLYIAEQSQVSAFNLRDGRALWNAKVVVRWPLVVADGLVLVASDRALRLLRAEDGSPRWSAELSAKIAAPPAFKDGMIFVGLETGELAALRAADGAVVWKRNLGAHVLLPPTSSRLAVLVALSDRSIVSLEIDTGRVAWVRPLPAMAGSLSVVDGAVVVGTGDKDLYCLKSDSGRNRWRRRIGAVAAGAAWADKKNVYYVARDNVLWTLSRRSGDVRWRQLLPFRPLSGPVVLGDNVAVAVVGPELYLFSRQTGEQVAAVATKSARVPGDVGVTARLTQDGMALFGIALPDRHVLLYNVRANGPASITAP